MFNSKTKFLGGIILGTIVGAVSGLLFAPSAGKETRKKMKKLIDENQEILMDAKGKTGEVVHSTLGAIKDSIGKVAKSSTEEKHPPRHRSTHHRDDSDEAAA